LFHNEQNTSKFETLNKEMDAEITRLMKAIETLQNNAKELRADRKKFLDKLHEGEGRATEVLSKMDKTTKDLEVLEDKNATGVTVEALSPLRSLAKLANEFVNKTKGSKK
jgi:predicted  nucleic acid-binding Zn-ribbon protein